jgi:hypothetical protein
MLTTRVSQNKKAAIMKTEIMSGARTRPVPQPTFGADVKAKIKRINATGRTLGIERTI